MITSRECSAKKEKATPWMMLIKVSSIFTTNPSNCVWAAEASFLPVESSADILLADQPRAPRGPSQAESRFALDRLVEERRDRRSDLHDVHGFRRRRFWLD